MALAALFVADSGAPARSETAPRFDERFGGEGPAEGRQDERSWPAALRTDCGSATTEPSVCIRRHGGRFFRKGEPITAEVSWSNVTDAMLIVSLEHDAPPGTHYLGATGALAAAPANLSGSGSMTFRWGGRGFACETDTVPSACPVLAEIGRYRLRASIHDRRPEAFVRRGLHGLESPPLAWSLSTPLVVTGQPDLSALARSMWWAAVNEGRRTTDIDFSNPFAGDNNGSAVRVRERAGLLCGHMPAIWPYLGALDACIPKVRLIGEAGLLDVPPEELRVTGRISLAQGAISGREAVTLAQAVADRPYRPRVRFHRQPQMREAGYDSGRDGDFHQWSRRNPHATTYLSDSVSEAIYRPDLGGAWFIVVDEIMAGGSVPDDQRFADKVLVLVQADRRACVLETAPYRGGRFSLDPRTATRRC